jgi:hypothetical protein
MTLMHLALGTRCADLLASDEIAVRVDRLLEESQDAAKDLLMWRGRIYAVVEMSDVPPEVR